MNCNCLTEINGKLLEHMKQPGRFKKTVRGIEIKGVTIQLTGDSLITRTYSDVEVELDGQKKKEHSPLIHTFCPFCGKKQDGAA